ncbi:GNAT family N-acetyltransferase [Kutzneria sp. 744]|uniref:GNAT family N-acetyltransferase n=1 Tax=Kutzneria sp. (strain 744) TaxID=345341 RepID=UPI0005BA4514|nr:GNAT family N-acetyltransferase [Kutzneria sp. 744]
MRTVALGLPVAVVDVAEALNGDWRAHRHSVDVVRVQDPPPLLWDSLAAAGFRPKPQVVTWRAATASDEEQFLSGLARKDKQNIRIARRRARADGLTITVRPVDAGLMDAFLPLYEAQVARMVHGWSVATEHRDRVLAEADDYFAVCAWDGDILVGASINQQSRERDEVRARFSAVVADQRQASLTRVLYLEVVREARERGFAMVSLGSDPNLYGHLVKPGLFSFKSRLGFVPVPSHLVDPDSGSDQADRVVGFDAITDPSFVLSYAQGVRGPSLALDLYTTKPGIDLRPYTVDHLADVRVHQLEGDRP